MPQVYPAEPYRYCELGSLGKANCMLLVQFDFPDIYEESERMASMYSDRLDESQSGRVAKCLHRYGLNCHTFDGCSQDFEHWIRRFPKERLITFIAEVLGVVSEAQWTGCRVTGEVGGNGHALFHFMLFARDPSGNTQIYTGEPAPNVLAEPRRR